MEILAVSASDGDGKSGSENEISPGISIHSEQEEAIQLILKLIKQIVAKNHGTVRYKVYDDKPMIFISLILPIERRNVVRYPSPEERLNKAKGVEK